MMITLAQALFSRLQSKHLKSKARQQSKGLMQWENEFTVDGKIRKHHRTPKKTKLVEVGKYQTTKCSAIAHYALSARTIERSRHYFDAVPKPIDGKISCITWSCMRHHALNGFCWCIFCFQIIFIWKSHTIAQVGKS